MKMIENAKDVLKFRVVQVLGIGTILFESWNVLPPDYQGQIIEMFFGIDPGRWIPLLTFVGAVFARLQYQPGLHPESGPYQPPGAYYPPEVPRDHI